MNKEHAWIAALILAVGLVAASLVVGSAVRDFRVSDRHVEVKGFAERDVAADLAIWPINYQVAGNSLEDVLAALEQADEAVIAFLKLRGFSEAEITRQQPRINDQWQYSYGEHHPPSRYTAERGITLRTEQVDVARSALQEASDLIGQGVLLAQNWGQEARFMFTALDDIKPDMIADATADARRAASQFAADSGSQLGPIRRARQGYFTIDDRDPSTPEVKRVRVVTTIEYLLK